MTERSYQTIDKSKWPRGPWDDEPDKVQWKDDDTGLPCLAVRHSYFGHWCGYVGVSEGHPVFEKGYDDSETDHISVHGGLTYADHCMKGDEATAICHVPEPGEPDHVWWLGFDCHHWYDKAPGYESRYKSDHGTYRTLDYVKSQCRDLARQLMEMKDGKPEAQ